MWWLKESNWIVVQRSYITSLRYAREDKTEKTVTVMVICTGKWEQFQIADSICMVFVVVTQVINKKKSFHSDRYILR